MMAEVQWIIGTADRGQNFYNRPVYTEVHTLFESMFDTDIPSVVGYKRLMQMTAVSPAKSPIQIRYLAIAYKDRSTGQWKVLATESDDGVDVDKQVGYFATRLQDMKLNAEQENYELYGHWLLLAGRLRDAARALVVAQKASTTPDENALRKLTGEEDVTKLQVLLGADDMTRVQIEAQLDVISHIADGQVLIEARASVTNEITTEAEKAQARVSLDADMKAQADAERKRRQMSATREMIASMQFVPIYTGQFLMGCSMGDKDCASNETPAHRVRITTPFEMGKYEVTQAQWERVMGTNPSSVKGLDQPVESVNWTNVQEFLKILNESQSTHRYRLPTEAEWEYAARAGSTVALSTPIATKAWYQTNSTYFMHPVGQKQPNAWGIYDMQGNAAEWVADWWSVTYEATTPIDDPKGTPSGEFRVVRGGAFVDDAKNLRFSARKYRAPGSGLYTIGFRFFTILFLELLPDNRSSCSSSIMRQTDITRSGRFFT
jgi:formylglycine-generating enzyme required for sulfatase activity